ncbi:hypothetical protein EVAR_96945_1 [Eumeta japonica]|uniref:Uncharacterized protein n=1 Tax=Eumeta variegata TaxID=151549 RepID=A0A4C1VF87_EUMVA|nr:hypothetical protein EVAR_96945_1 [Eumeta japonica]
MLSGEEQRPRGAGVCLHRARQNNARGAGTYDVWELHASTGILGIRTRPIITKNNVLRETVKLQTGEKKGEASRMRETKIEVG